MAIAVLFGLDLAYNLAVSPNNLARSLGLVNSASNPLAASINKFFTSVGDKLAIFGGFMRGMAEGAAQGFFNIVNGVQDQIIGLANLAIKAALISLGPAGLQFDISIPSPDWSYGLIFDEPRTQHGVSKFLGGLGVSLLLTGLLGLTGAGGSAATLNAGELQLSRTVAGHAATRPYVNSRLLVQEIINSKPPIPDPGGIPGGLRWDVFGAFNGSQGLFELVVDPATKTIVHFLFKSV